MPTEAELAGEVVALADGVRHRRPYLAMERVAGIGQRQRLEVGKTGREQAPLRRHLQPTKSVPAMVPGEPRTGPVHPVWQLVENDGEATHRSAQSAGERRRA